MDEVKPPTRVTLTWDVWSAQDVISRTILVELRLPRAILGVFVGASLGLAGAAMRFADYLDVTGLPRLTEALLRRHPEARVERLMGGNLRRFFRETLGG